MMKANKCNEGSQGIKGQWPGAEIEMTEEERANAMGAMGWKGRGCLENNSQEHLVHQSFGA